MPLEAKDIDELESLLSGMSDDELAQLDNLDAPTASAPVIDADVEDAVVEPVPTKAPIRKKRLKPLAEDPVEVVSVVTTSSEEDDLAALDSLDKPTVLAAHDDLATQIVNLLVELQIEFADLSEDEFSAKCGVIIGKIDINTEIGEIEAMLREALNPAPPENNELDPSELMGLPVMPIEIEEPVAVAPSADDDDAELAALLAAAPDDPTPVAPSAPSAPIKVTPTKKAGALNTFIDADRLQEDLAFTTTSISLAMTRQAALFAHYSRLSADATYQSDRSKQQVELLEATLNQRFRDSLIAAGTKFTEKSIDSMVIQDSSYQAAQERAHEARAIAKMVDSAADSFRHRKDMLIQVGADLRMEKQGELRMREHPGEAAKRSMGA